MKIFFLQVFIFLLIDHLCYTTVEFNTSFNASFNTSNCLLTDRNRQYNLTDVSTIVTDFENSDSQLVINLCNLSQTKKCLESDICIFQNNNIKYLEYEKVEYSIINNIIEIKYFGKNETTHIKLICSPGTKSSKPWLSMQNNDKIVTWETKSACPLGDFHNNSCILKLPQMNVTFDFNILNTLYTERDSQHNHDYYLMPCGDLNNSTIHQNLREGQTISLGKIHNKLLQYHDGELVLRYFNGTRYKDGLERESKIYFLCNKTVGIGVPKFIKEIPPTYIFEWKTVYACVNEMPLTCIWSNSTHRIDFTMLLDNLFAFQNSSIVYIYNLCRPLQKAKAKQLITCDPPIGICRNHTNIGSRLLSPPKLNKEGKFEFDFVDGSECGTQRYSTKLYIGCGYGDLLGRVSQKDECSYTLNATHYLLCEPHRVYANHCVFTDEFTGFKVDLNFAFKDVKFINGINFTLCQNNLEMFHEAKCKDAALCGLKNDGKTLQSYGNIWSHDYNLKDKVLQLSFYNGSSCDEIKGKSWSSLLNFKCDPKISSPEIVLLSNSSCQMVYDIKLSDVCSLTNFVCTLRREGKFFNLRSLSSLHHSWTVKNKQDEYSINICRWLPDFQDSQSTALLTTEGKSHKIGDLRTMNLYFEDSSENSNIILRYDAEADTLCSTNGSKVSLPISTIIKFICNEHHHNYLSFQEKKISNGYCIFNFKIETFYACPSNRNRQKVHLIFKNSKLYDPHYKLSFDISPIVNLAHIVKHNSMNYIFNISGTISDKQCMNAAICQKGQIERDIGSHNTIIFFSQGLDTKVLTMQAVSTNGQKCGKNLKKNVTTEITFYCSENNGYGEPQFLYESMDCDYYFEWFTNLTCFNTSYLIDSQDSQLTNVQFSIPIDKSPSLGIFLVISVVFLIAASALGLYILRRSDLKRRWQKDSIYFTNLIELADPI